MRKNTRNIIAISFNFVRILSRFQSNDDDCICRNGNIAAPECIIHYVEIQ